MEDTRFLEMVGRLEVQSRQSPLLYQTRVALLALAGFGLLLLVFGFAGASILMIGGLGILLFFSGGKALWLVVKFGKALILLLIPCWMLIRSSFSALFARMPLPQGLALDPRQAPELFAALENMRRQMKGPRFHHVLIDENVNAAVYQRPLFGLIGFPRNYLILGLPLMESLTPEEMLAVLAHEYGHLADQHNRFSNFIYRLRQSWGSIQELSKTWEGWAGRKLHELVSWYAPYLNAYTFVLARATEYDADAASARLVGADAATSALKRVRLAAEHRARFMQATLDEVAHRPNAPVDLEQRWAGLAPQAAMDADAAQWLEIALQRVPHAMDTHPSLAHRLAALSGKEDASKELPPAFSGPSAARAWLGTHAEVIRNQLQSAWQADIAPAWQSRHQELRAQRERLDALRQQTERSLDEEIERLRLQIQLEPAADNLGALTAFNATHPDVALPLFWEADLRLEAKDDKGLELLEQLMTLDPDAVPMLCERASDYLAERDPARAEAYARRGRESEAHQQQLSAELDALNPEHTLQAIELDELTRSKVSSILARHADQLAEVRLARRVLPADPDVMTLVLGFRPTLMTKLLRREQKLLGALLEEEWPFHVFIVNLRLQKPIRKKLGALAGAVIPLPKD